MIIHTGIAVSSSDRADLVFEHIFEMKRLYSFEIEKDIVDVLFGGSSGMSVRVYDAGTTRLEVFITPEAASYPAGFHHICLGVPDRNRLLKKARAAELEVRRYERSNGSDVIFVVDRDGNLYEIKEISQTT